MTDFEDRYYSMPEICKYLGISRDSAPKYLYHYTDVDTFALILKNKTIRLNSLDKIDNEQLYRLEKHR